MKYYTSREASKLLDVHPNTLRKWADNGEIESIRTVSGQRRYCLERYLRVTSSDKVVCYCRVSSSKQKDDLARQVEYMQASYPDAEIVKDIGSGLNFKRRGLKAILERAMSGERITLVVAYRDRLARFGYELIKQVIERSSGKLVVLNEITLSPTEELTRDLLSIIQVFSCRLHGLRNYQKQIAEIATHSATTQ
jgi:excisionase family DNA binding protein